MALRIIITFLVVSIYLSVIEWYTAFLHKHTLLAVAQLGWQASSVSIVIVAVAHDVFFFPHSDSLGGDLVIL